ncbi:hypothetical protein [Bacteroides nordii]|uniref:hypothetical protein n=1 Tax=Bacteroides nordii TaxID=291645 RepID=UPI00399A4207
MQLLKTYIITGRDKFFLVVYSLFAAFILVPFVSDITPLNSQIVDLAVFVTCILLYPRAYGNRLMLWTFAYFMVLFLFVISGNDITIGIGKVAPSKKLLIELAWLLPSICVVSILRYKDNLKLYYYVAIISVSLYIISFLSVLPIIMEYDMRVIAIQEEAGVSIHGIPSYTLMHAFAISLPAAFMSCKAFIGKPRLVMLALAVCNIILVVNTNITTSIVALLICIIFFLSYGGTQGFNFFRLAILSICIFVIWNLGLVEIFLNYMSGWFEGTAVQPKIESFIAVYQSGDLAADETGSISGRETLHAISIDSFLSNIFLGGGQVGGHSAILDRLGGMGLFCGIPFIMIFISQIVIWKKKIYDHLALMYYYLGVLVACIFLYTKGLFGEQGWFMISIFVPVVIYVCSLKKS